MREILFRGKRVDNDEWVYGTYFGGGRFELIITSLRETDFLSRYSLCDAYEVDPETVGQYTGLKDRKGNMIFEGDIVEWISPKSDTDGSDISCKIEVVWGSAGFDAKGYEYGIVDFMECEGLESVNVIGNIHDAEVQND